MERSRQDFDLNSVDQLTLLLKEQGVTTWLQACRFIRELPYGRNANRVDLNLVITENKGTCSSKHAFLKQIAILNEVPDVELIVGIYKMNGRNTPKVGVVLSKYHLDYIPEAHCYLKYREERVDYTGISSDTSMIKPDLMQEITIEPHQVSEYKVAYHQEFVKKWLKSEADISKAFTFDDLWSVREECIECLSK